MAMITDIEDYFQKGCGRCPRFATPDCATRLWRDELAELRTICRRAGLRETVKWGHPCYMLAGRNIAIIGAHRDGCRLSFFDAALMSDPDGILVRQGPNTRHADMIPFACVAQVRALAPVIQTYLQEAMSYAKAGLRPTPEPNTRDLPEELTTALDADPVLAKAFFALTPGRQNSYVIDLSRAKKPETRIARIAKFRDKIIAGRGATER